MTRIYVSGRVTGDANHRVKFAAAEHMLNEAGFEAVNPARRGRDELPWAENMRTALSLMLGCDGVALLDDWKGSRGAQVEAWLAVELGIPAKPLAEWLCGCGPCGAPAGPRRGARAR